MGTVTQIRPRETPASPLPSTPEEFLLAYTGLSREDLEVLLESVTAR